MTLSIRRSSIALALVFATQLACAADFTDIRVNQLEQDILQLKQTMQQQARRIEVLESALSQSLNQNRIVVERPARTGADDGRAWLKRSNWEKLKVGMPEAEVVQALGPPTTSRPINADSKSRTLFYSLELEAGGFLTGTVVVVEQRVAEIHKPTLR